MAGVLDMVTQLAKGFPPKCESTPTLPQLAQAVLKRSEYFCKAQLSIESGKKSVPVVKEVRGAEAIKALWNQAPNVDSTLLSLALEAVKPLKQFCGCCQRRRSSPYKST